MDNFEVEAIGMGFNPGSYPGAFTPRVRLIIESIIYGRVLNLYSGSSRIGDERIDINHINATRNECVEDFIQNDKRNWDWVILDPPYWIASERNKLSKYGSSKAVSSNVPLRNELRKFFIERTQNILWLDVCAPMVRSFTRHKLWLLLPGGFHTVRILSWLQKE